MKHSMVEKSTKEQIQTAERHADWLLDSIACATQDRRFLRGDDECDQFLCDAILGNGKISALHVMHNYTP